MSLEIINVTYALSSKPSALTAFIKEKTGLEITLPETGNVYKMRFPDMENAKSVSLSYTFGNGSTGTMFIDVANHFFVYAVGDGVSTFSYLDSMYEILIYDYNGELGTITASNRVPWNYTNTNLDTTDYIAENDPTKNEIALVPFRTYGQYYVDANTNMYVKTFVKNAYVNYERKFQPGLKFIDQNGNKFVTLGGYLLYKVD